MEFLLVMDHLEKQQLGDLRDDAGDDDRRERADGKILENHFQREQHAAERRIEDCADSGGASAADEHRHLPAGDAKKLPDSGGDSSPDLNDGAFGAGRPAAADGDARGEDFLEGDQRALESAGPDDGFDDINDAMSLADPEDVYADQADDQPAGRGERHQQRHPAP